MGATKSEVIGALRNGRRASMVRTKKPGHHAVYRDSVMRQLGIGPEDSAEVDAIVEQVGGHLFALETTRRSQGLRPGKSSVDDSHREGTMFYGVPGQLLDD